MRFVVLLLVLAGCGGSSVRVERARAHAGIAILSLEQIAHMRGPTAMLVAGADRRLPVWLHADRTLDFRAVASRCDGGRCDVTYDADDDVFECACTGDEFTPDGRAVDGDARLVTYPVVFRNEAVVIELRPGGR